MALPLLVSMNETVPVGCGLGAKAFTVLVRMGVELDPAHESVVAVGSPPVTLSEDVTEVLVALVFVPTKTAL